MLVEFMKELSIYNKLVCLPLFQGLGSSEMSWIIEKIKFNFCKFNPGQYLIHQDTPCSDLVFVLDGEIEIETSSPDGVFSIHEPVSAPLVLQPEVLFGPRTYYTHSYIAASEVGALSISKSQFWESLLQYEVFRINFINTLSAEAQLAQRTLWMPQCSLVSHQIIRFILQHCCRPFGPKRIKIKMESLAHQLCETRANVSRALNELKDKNLLYLKRSSIEIPQLERLHDVLKENE